jgi:O-antigen/teichoic acid export membrane protein
MQDEILDPETRVNVSVWARGGAAGLIGIFLGVALSIAWQFALARLLGAAGLGDISLATTLLVLLTALLPLGLDMSAVRYVAFHYARRELGTTLAIMRITTFGSLLLSLVAAPLLVWQSDWIAFRLFAKPELGALLKVLLSSLPFAILMQVQGSILHGFQRIGTRLLVQQVLVQVFRLMGLLLLVLGLATLTTLSVAAVMVVASAIGALIMGVLVSQQSASLKLNSAAVGERASGLFRYSGRAVLNLTLEQLSAALPVFLLGIMSTSAQIGIFGVAFRAAVIVALQLGGLNFIAAPAMSASHATRNLSELRSLYTLITRWGLTLALPVFLILTMLASEIMAVFGQEFRAGALALQLLAAGQMLCVATGPCRSLLNVTDHQRVDVINNLLALALGTAIGLVLIPPYGALGAAAGAATYLMLVNLLGLIRARQVLHMHPYSVPVLKPLLAGLFAAGLAWGLRLALSFAAEWIRLGVVAAAILLIYAASLLALRLQSEDRLAFQSLIQRLH